MEQKATATLNQVCRELGICDSEAILRTARIKHAAELYKEDGKRVIRVACWSDGKVTSCVVENEDGKTKREVCCYTAEDGGEELYYAWQAHLTSLEVGYKVRSVEAEGGLPEITERITAGVDVK